MICEASSGSPVLSHPLVRDLSITRVGLDIRVFSHRLSDGRDDRGFSLLETMYPQCLYHLSGRDGGTSAIDGIENSLSKIRIISIENLICHYRILPCGRRAASGYAIGQAQGDTLRLGVQRIQLLLIITKVRPRENDGGMPR